MPHPIDKLTKKVGKIADKLEKGKKTQSDTKAAAIKALDARIAAAKKADNQDLVNKYTKRRDALKRL